MSVVEQYNSGVSADTKKVYNHELELTTSVTRDTFITAYKRASDKLSTLETSINVIRRSDQTNLLRKMIFVGTVKKSDTFESKETVARETVHGEFKYNVRYARERVIEQFSTTPDSDVRMKIRASTEIIDGWRYDFTMVYQNSWEVIGNGIMSAKNELFNPKLTVANLLTDIPHLINKYEIEAEWLGQLSLSSQDIQNAVSFLSSLFGETDFTIESELSYLTSVLQPGVKYKGTRMKRLANQVSTITKRDYQQVFPPDGWILTDKPDGIRCMVTLRGGICKVISDKLYIAKDHKLDLIDGGSDEDADTTSVEGSENTNNVIIDAELLINGDAVKVYAFDCMWFGANISNDGYEVRIKHLDAACKVISRYIPCVPKTLITLDKRTLEQQISEFEALPREYHTDGLILSRPGASYKDTLSYKWKPLSQTTIDFKAIKCPPTMLGMGKFVAPAGHTVYLLFNGIGHEMRLQLGIHLLPQYRSIVGPTRSDYYPVQFAPSANPYAYIWYAPTPAADAPAETYDGKIVELRVLDGKWDLVRVRTDRANEPNYFGNDYRVAELTYNNYIDEFRLSDLWAPSKGYFQQEVGNTYRAAHRYKRFVISMLVADKLANSTRIMDLMCGRGADIHRYVEVGVKEALCIDIDAVAITELIMRKYEYRRSISNNKKRQYGQQHHSQRSNSMIIHTLVSTMKRPAAELTTVVEQFGYLPRGVDGAVCNFALHYLCDNEQNIDQFFAFVGSMLSSGGTIIITMFNGESVFNALKETPVGGTHEWREDTVVKYAIGRKYTDAKLLPFGQTISVKLPFSADFVDEPLANIAAIAKVAKRHKMELDINVSFSVYLQKFSAEVPNLANSLTDIDREYIALHNFVTFVKR